MKKWIGIALLVLLLGSFVIWQSLNKSQGIIKKNNPVPNSPININPSGVVPGSIPVVVPGVVPESVVPGVSPVPIPVVPSPPDNFTSLCLAQKGVVNMDNYNLSCKTFNTGTIIPIPQTFPGTLSTTNTIESYLKVIYPLVSQFPPDFYNKLYFYYNSAPTTNKTEIVARNSGKLYLQPETTLLYNTSHVEVSIQESVYNNLIPTKWVGCWYDMVEGTGFFIPTGVTMMAFNALHCLKLIGISPENILQYSSAEFKKQLTTRGKTIAQALEECDIVSTYNYNYLNNEIGPKRYVSSMTAQRGYKTLQLSNEFDGTFRRRYFVDLLDPVLSTLKLVRRNPFETTTNPERAHWYLNLFNKGQVADKYVINPEPNKKFYEFAFKENCRLAGGIISIKDVYLNCLKILKFGTPSQILMSEPNGDYSAYKKSNQLEKLQSYFTIVYGNENVWKSKSEEELQKKFDHFEMFYKIPMTQLGLTATPKGARSPDTLYNTPTAYYNANVSCLPFLNRPAELMEYVEVFRQNERFSLTEDPLQFASFYYLPTKGSGYFLPTGKMMATARKNSAVESIGQAAIPEPDWEADKTLAREMMYKGYDTLIITNFSNRSEVIHFRDAITSQMSLIRTHPYDPIVNKKSSNVVMSDPYFKEPTAEPNVLHKNCTITHQFDGSVDNVCIY